MDDTADHWYYLHPSGENYGPFSSGALQDLYTQGFLLADMVVWKQGRDKWLPFKDVPELFDKAKPPAALEASDSKQQDSTTNGHTVVNNGSLPTTTDAPKNFTDGAVKRPVKGAMVAAAAARRTDGAEPVEGADDELAAFEAEMGLLGALQPKEQERPSTPDELRFQDDDGTWYEWDPRLRKYVEAPFQGPLDPAGPSGVPQYDEEDMAYDGEVEIIPEYNPPQVGSEEAAEDIADELDDERQGIVRKGKRKHMEEEDAMDKQGDGEEHDGMTDQQQQQQPAGKGGKKKGQEQAQGWVEIKVNTSVYITGLPEDVTESELVDVFKKCGLVKLDDDNKPKVKIYRDKQTGRPKGDGLVTYLKQPSVALACQLLDGTQFRLGQGKDMTVSEAKFEQKGDAFVPKAQDKKKKKKKKGKPGDKELGWDGFDDVAKTTEATVILKHMFSPTELRGNKKLIKDLTDDVADECRKHGSIGKIRVFQWNPEGVVSVRFLSSDAADTCIQKMNGRFFGGRKIEALLWDGSTNYHVTAPKESAEDEEARLEAFSRELESAEPPKFD